MPFNHPMGVSFVFLTPQGKMVPSEKEKEKKHTQLARQGEHVTPRSQEASPEPGTSVWAQMTFGKFRGPTGAWSWGLACAELSAGDD